MALIHFDRRPFDTVAEHLTSTEREPVTLAVPVADGVLTLTPATARLALYGPGPNGELRRAVWRQAVLTAQQAADPQDEPLRLFAVWLVLPRLHRSLWTAARRFGADVADLQAEALLSLLEVLPALDPDSPDPGGTLARAAVNRAWTLARQCARERCVADLAAIAAARLGRLPDPAGLPPEAAWELGIDPPPRPDGLCAPIRFTTSRTHVEGVRLGALAQYLGLREVVHRARRPGEGNLIGTLSLRPTGAPR